MDSMSCVGSVISTSISTVTEEESDTKTPLHRCSYLRSELGLNQYKLNGNSITAESIPHVKISSKTLKECFVLPAGGTCIEEVFEKLANFLSYCKTNRVKPIRTDFTCLSRLKRDKLFIDVDCLVCKRGELPRKFCHFSQTKSLDTIISTVCEVFNKTVSEGIYMTKGGTCGYHLFFNGLTFSETVTKSVLMDALDNAFRQAELTQRAAIDRGCTQMPLPTACHSKSLNLTVPYELIKDDSGWKKKKLDWREMDADKLKCFSNIAFLNRFEALKEAVVADKGENMDKKYSLSDVGTSVGKKRKILGVEMKEDDGKIDSPAAKKMCLLQTEALNLPPPLPTPSSSPPPPPPILSPPLPLPPPPAAAALPQPPPPMQAIISIDTQQVSEQLTNALSKQASESWQQLGEGDNDFASVISQYTEATEDDSFICPSVSSKITREDHHGTQKRVCPPPSDDGGGNEVASVFSAYTEADNSFVCPSVVSSKVSTRDRGPQRGVGSRPCEDVNEVASVLSVYDEATEEDSFICPSIAQNRGPQGGTLPKTGKHRYSSNALDSLPYNCGHDKQSLFADKQYKAAFLSVEEDEASKSKARLNLENDEKERVFYLPGNSTRLSREYKLLVQLTNVNRSIYGGDVIARREWINLQVSYYDQHLHNPVVLEILRFVFSDKDVETLFDRRTEVDEIKRSIVYVMASFKSSYETDAARMSDLLDTDEHAEREARPHKSRIVSALIRVCTHLFGMVTAVFSDLRKVQQLMERKDLSLLNRTVVNDKVIAGAPEIITRTATDSDDDLDCSASMTGGITANSTDRLKSASNYMLLASLIAHEQKNVSDQALYAFLYYYHFFPLITIDRILDEVHHDGLMVSAVIKYFMIYNHSGKPLTLQDIFEGFNDAVIALTGPEQFIKMKRKNKNRSDPKKQNNSNSRSAPQPSRRGANKNNANTRRMSFHNEYDDSSNTSDRLEEDNTAGSGDVTKDEVDKLMCGPERRRRRLMCKSHSSDDNAGEQRVVYEWKDKHLWQAVINYYLRPVVMHEDRLVFANDSYDTFEDDAVESCVAHVMTKNKITKADVTTAFKDARTVWRMHHGSQMVYESDLRSDKMGCYFHINIALKMYEMFCGGCVTRMKRVHKNYLIDRSRFNMSVYDVVAECRTATVNLSSAIDRSYMNLLLNQPVVPPFLEDVETRQLFLSEVEIQRGSFCCLSVMDYIRTMNLFERANCQTKPELENCDFIERFLDDLYINEIAAERPPDIGANAKMRLLYAFYSLYLFECIFAMRHAYMVRENCNISVERLCYELDIRELLVLFFGESSMEKVKGINAELEQKICQTAKRCTANFTLKSEEDTSTADCRFDVTPVLAAEIPDKMQRMKTLFGQFGFDVMQEGSTTSSSSSSSVMAATTTTTNKFTTDCYNNPFSMENGVNSENLDKDCHINKRWDDESKFEHVFYESENWLETVCERIHDDNITGKSSTHQTPILSNSTSCEGMFLRETVRSVMRLELKKHIDHDRLGKLSRATRANGSCNNMFSTMKHLPMRLKLLAFILTVHTFKLKTRLLAPDFIEETYRNADGRFTDEYYNDEGEEENPPEKVWCRTTVALLNDRRSLLLHARWLAKQRFKSSFFVGLNPARVYSALYDYMRENEEKYPAFKRYNDSENTTSATLNLCTAMMYILIMSAYDQEHLDLYLKVFLAVEWPGQWAKTIFVWKSNSNAGKSYLFDSIIKRACANSTCINDPKGGKENAPEKAEYVKNFVLFANEFSQANSNELKKIVSESTFKFRMNYGNMMNEAYATGKIMFNCNTLPPTSDEAAINRLTLFNIPFWFCKRQRISDAMLNWICGLSVSNPSRWEMAYRYQLPSLLTEAEKIFFESHSETKNETDLLDEYAAIRPNFYSTEFNKSTSLLFLVQNKISRLYASSSPPTDRIVHGLVNITNHFSWLRFFKRLDTPVDFTTLPASSEAIRSEWLSLTLPYQEWKTLTGAKTDPSGRVPAETINRSLQAFSVKKNINYFGIKQFFETDFASSREAIKDEYYMRFDSKVFNEH